MITIVLADDHDIVRNGIKTLLDGEEGLNVVGEADNGQEAIEAVKRLRPKLLISDIRMPIMNGLDTVAKLKQEMPEVKVLMLTMHDDSEYILKSLQYGADGYLLKDASKPEFLKAIHTVCDGHKYFSGDISNTIVNSYLSVLGKKPIEEPSTPEEAEAQTGILTKREREILQLVYRGASNKEIAEELGKSVRTIETHRFNMMKKMGVGNVAEMLKKAEKEGLLQS